MAYDSNVEYTPPAMLGDIDDEAIHARMMEALPIDIDNTEGGFAYEFTRPASIEAANLMIDMNEIIQMMFPAWSYGAWLDQIAAGDGIARKSAVPATGIVTVTGAAGTIVPAGSIFYSPSLNGEANIEFATISTTAIPETGKIDIAVECAEAGVVGNVPAASVTVMSSPINGVESVANAAAFTGGTEEEDDDGLRERIRIAEQNRDVSYVGSVADYERWALEVDGVGGARAISEWMGAGTGTVKLVISDGNGDPASQTILTGVYNHIMAPDAPSERKAPIGLYALTVVATQGVPINVAARVKLGADAVLANVQSDFEEALASYFYQRSGNVIYTKIGGLLSSVGGVLDYDTLLVNTGTANVGINTDEVAELGTVALEAMP